MFVGTFKVHGEFYLIFLTARTNFFLIKGRANTNGTIVDAYTDEGSRLNQYIGKKA